MFSLRYSRVQIQLTFGTNNFLVMLQLRFSKYFCCFVIIEQFRGQLTFNHYFINFAVGTSKYISIGHKLFTVIIQK